MTTDDKEIAAELAATRRAVTTILLAFGSQLDRLERQLAANRCESASRGFERQALNAMFEQLREAGRESGQAQERARLLARGDDALYELAGEVLASEALADVNAEDRASV
jgi:hypothetical protein